MSQPPEVEREEVHSWSHGVTTLDLSLSGLLLSAANEEGGSSHFCRCRPLPQRCTRLRRRNMLQAPKAVRTKVAGSGTVE